MASIANQEALKNPNAIKPPSPPTSAAAAFIQLSSSASDAGVSDDDADAAINNGDSHSAKRPRVSDGEIPTKKPKLDDDILPLGFLDPLPPEDLPEVVIAPPISVLPSPLPPPRVMPVLRSCKQFWKAGDYNGQPSSDLNTVPGMDHVRVHPKFLHSNATSHKWALGALVELLDNSMDEVSHGATFVKVDMLKNTKDGTKMLLVEDNGGGMDPDKMRQCMSLGYSVKSKSANTIGQYGNGFKTSTMRLGADVIVFSRCGKGGGSCTQSIGLLSYTFLRNTGKEDIVVPLIDYVKEGDVWTKMIRSSAEVWNNNLETIIQWSPYYSEADLLQQFNIMTDQGTRIIIYNLWDDDQGELELDFDADQHDIQVRGANRDEKKIQMAKQFPNSRHFLTYRHSLRSYASILYLKLPHGFRMILRGKDIEHHNIVNDMMLKQEVKYRPQPGPDGVPKDPSMFAVVMIGFVKDAKDHIDVQGFNVYHKNRLIKPFWRIWNAAGSQGRGIIGVLEANFVEPAHDKQGFERTTVLSRLEARLLLMQKSYWYTPIVLYYFIFYFLHQFFFPHLINLITYSSQQTVIKSAMFQGVTRTLLMDQRIESSPEDPQSSSKGPPKGMSPDVSKNCKTRDSSSCQNSSKSLHSSHNMTESSASKSLNGAGKYDKDVQFMPLSRSYGRQNPTSDQRGIETRYSAMEKAASCGGAGVQPLPAKSKFKASDVTCYGIGPVTMNSFQQLTDENKALKNRLKNLEEIMLLELHYEREKNIALTEQIKALEEKLKVLNNEQEALINIFQEEMSRREIDEENLKNKLKEATTTIQDLVGKLYSEHSHTKKEL